ncbi:MAG TPA: Uma2 family endonuclease [Planctomycetota bacterium]|nr:Uma2 family endonuclease [Planctomycetota bacterium]
MRKLSGPELVAVEEYLADEVRSAARHEYVGGFTYAMAGASNAHNLIATNSLVALANRLRKGPCRPFNSDTKIRLRLSFGVRFYYPDVSVTCRPNPQSDSFQDEPAVVVEIVSAETRRIDEGEKLLAYTAIPSLAAYLLIEQESAQAVVFRRAEQGFVREVHAGLDAAIPLSEIGCELPLAEVYDGVEFSEGA